MELKKLVLFLDNELNVAELNKLDDCNNGLQVDGKQDVKKIGFCVDACLDSYKKAAEQNCDMIICHHGLSWKGQGSKESMSFITSLNYKHISFLIKKDISLYAAHLPLDCHPRLGNNAVLCSMLGVKNLRKFGEYKGAVWGFCGELDTTFADLVKKTEKMLGIRCKTFPFGKKNIKQVAVITGKADFAVEEAAKKGIDCYITGETNHSAYHRAKDLGLNIIFGGHYATETLGVKAIGKLLEKKFGIKCVFIDCPTGL